MLEIPEAYAISRQLAHALTGQTIQSTVAGRSPHGFAWYNGLPDAYPSLLDGQTIQGAHSVAGYVQIDLGEITLLFADGVNLRLIPEGRKRPPKHQLLLELSSGSALSGSVQMYGGLWAFETGAFDNPYYAAARDKPSPLTDAFDEAYFDRLLREIKPTLSAKAFLATEQRIPGLGNGVLQDILFLSGIHPRRSMDTLSSTQVEALFENIKMLLRTMTDAGGRDTEKDLYGNPGGYRTLLSRKTLGLPCPGCGGQVQRKAYLGGNVYFCERCQPLRPE